MGKVRLWIETTLRDVVLLLHREAVPSATIKRVSNRLAALQRDVVDHEHLHRTKDSDGVEASEICRGIMASVLAKVLEVEIPERAVRDLEMDVRVLQLQIREAEKERDRALRQVEEAKKLEKRHSDAHMYALHCYFREVYQLRQAIQHPSHSSATMGSPSSSHSTNPVVPISFAQAGGLTAERSMGAFAPIAVVLPNDATTFAAGPSPHRASVAASSRVEVSNPLDNSGEGVLMTSRTTAPPLLQATRSMRLQKGQVTSQAEAEAFAALASVQQLYCTDAIFDYETYLDLQRSDELGWEGKYYALKETYEGFQQQVDRDKAAALKAHADDVRRERERQEQLQQKYNKQVTKTKTIQLLVSANARDFRQQLADLRDQLSKSRGGMLEAMRQLNVQVTSLSDYNQVLVDFVKAASKYMGEMTHSYFATGSGGNNTVEELTRFRFQRSLVPAPTDTVNQREAKLYWRRHELSNVLFSTIMEQRQVHEERVASMATAQELRQLVIRLQNENTELLHNTGYAFAGVNRLLDAAALQAEQHEQRVRQLRINGYDGVGDMVETRSVEEIDMPLSIVAIPQHPPAGKLNSSTKSADALLMELPRSTAWLVGRKWKPAVAPSAADCARLEGKEDHVSEDQAQAATAIVMHNTYLRPKYTEHDIDSTFVNDRLFLHRLFACARDPHYYMRDGDREVILSAWRRHTHLVHERSKSVFQRIMVRSMHATLTTFTNDMVADIVKRGILEMGTAAMTRSDVLQWRESIEQLRDFNIRMDFNHVEKRQAALKAIEANIRNLYRTVERTVVDQVRGIFPPPKLRAHDVPVNGKDASDLADAQSAKGGAGGPGMVRTKSGRFVKSDLRRPTAGRMTASDVFLQDSIDWRSSGMDCAATQTDVSGDVAAAVVDRRTGRAARQNARDAHPGRIALVQTTGQFATISEQDDEAAEFFRVESLQPPRCIAVPTSGGIGMEHLNHMSIKLLTRTSLLTTIPSMRQAIEDSQQHLIAATSSPRGVHHTPILSLRQTSAGSARRPDTAGSVASVGSHLRSGRLLSANTSTQRAIGGGASSVAPPTSPRPSGSASARPPPVARAVSPNPNTPLARMSSASRRIGPLPPPVYGNGAQQVNARGITPSAAGTTPSPRSSP